MKKTISILTLIIFLLIAIAYLPAITNTMCIKAESGGNIALNKPVSSSGSIKIETEKDYNVNDGDYETKWCAGKSDFDPIYNWEAEGPFVIIDLESEYNIAEFIIFQASSNGNDKGIYKYNMLQYKVEVSLDKTVWQTLYDESINQKEEIITRNFSPVKARYFKLSSKQPSITDDSAIRIREIEIYEGTSAPINTTPAGSNVNQNSGGNLTTGNISETQTSVNTSGTQSTGIGGETQPSGTVKGTRSIGNTDKTQATENVERNQSNGTLTVIMVIVIAFTVFITTVEIIIIRKSRNKKKKK